MYRMIVYPGAQPQETDLLNTNRYAMVGLGVALQALLGTSTYVDGLACTPVGGQLQVQVGPGSIYSLQSVDATAYSTLPADTTDQIVKQGLTFGQTVLNTPAPATAGQSIVYLIEAQYQDVDTNPTNLPYIDVNGNTVYNTANSTRASVCAMQVKAGVAAATGSQVAPTADAGWMPLYTVTVANGASSIVAGNIAVAAGALFIGTKISQLKALASLGIGALLQTDGAGNLTIALGNGTANDGAGNLTLKLAGDGSLRLTSSGLQGNEPVATVTTGQTLNAASHGNNYVFNGGATGTFALAKRSTLWNGYAFTAFAKGAAIVLSPNSADSIASGAAGATYTIPKGAFALVLGDDTGNWSVPLVLGTAGTKQLGATVNDPGTGTLEIAEPVNPSVTGTNYTYGLSDQGQVRVRSNSGNPMADTLPTGVSNGWFVTAINADPSAALTISVPAGKQLNGTTNGALAIATGQTASFNIDGNGNFWTTVNPVPKLVATQATYINSSSSLNPGVYTVDTSAGPITITLEGTPATGDNYEFFDFAGTWASNNLILNPNGKPLQGSSSNFNCDVSGVDFRIEYKSSAWSLQ